MVLVYHHGAVPVDYIYTVAALYLHTGRLVHSIVHRQAALSLFSIFERFLHMLTAVYCQAAAAGARSANPG